MSTTRRQFMVLTLSGLGATLMGLQGCGQDAAEPVVPPDAENNMPDDVPEPSMEALPETRLGLSAVVLAWFEGADLEAIGALGQAFLRRFGTEAEAVEDLSAAVNIFAQSEAVTEALEAIDAAVIEDFEAPGLASVEGWQLSLTEARMCAIASLFPESEGG